MRTRCSSSDYMSLSTDERQSLVNDFLSLIYSRHSDVEFGYHSFIGIHYDEMVLSTIFHTLRESGKIESTGYMLFRLTK